jgi:hypothetical protein
MFFCLTPWISAPPSHQRASFASMFATEINLTLEETNSSHMLWRAKFSGIAASLLQPARPSVVRML